MKKTPLCLAYGDWCTKPQIRGKCLTDIMTEEGPAGFEAPRFACCFIYQYINTCHFRKELPFSSVFTAIKIANRLEIAIIVLILVLTLTYEMTCAQICKNLCFSFPPSFLDLSFFLSAQKLSSFSRIPVMKYYEQGFLSFPMCIFVPVIVFMKCLV